jgi:hypothetical protein
MKSSLVWLFAYFSVSIVFAADIGVQPLYFEFKNHGKQIESFEFEIKSNKATKVNLSIYNAKQAVSGKLDFIENNDQEIIKLKKNIVEFRRPGVKKIQGLIEYPKDVNKTHVYAVMVEEVRDEALRGVGILVRYAVVFKVTTNKKRVYERAIVNDLKLRHVKKKLVFQASFENITVKDFTVVSHAIIRDENKKFIEKVKLKTASSWQKKVDESIVFPNSKVHLTGMLRKIKRNGKYNVLIINTINNKKKISKKGTFIVDETMIEEEVFDPAKVELKINPTPIQLKMKKGRVGKYRIELINDHSIPMEVTLPKSFYKNTRKYYKFFPKKIKLSKFSKRNAVFSIKNDDDHDWRLEPLIIKMKFPHGDKEYKLPVELTY